MSTEPAADPNAAVNQVDCEPTTPMHKHEGASPAPSASNEAAGNGPDNVIYMSDASRAEGGGSGDRPPTRDADAAEQPEDDRNDAEGSENGSSEVHTSEQPENGDAESGGGDDDLDVLPFDELDEAAAQHKEDWRLPTIAYREPVHGEAVFDEAEAVFNRCMVLPEGAPEVLSLWVFAGYALHACNLPFAPRLMITAPGANSGKTTLLDLLTYLVRHPEPTSDITPASLYRSLYARKCVLIDEADHNLPSRAGSRNELIQMINAGHKRATAVVIRTESVKTPNGTIRLNRRYPIFAPVAMAGIGSFAPNTTRSRCFVIPLKRKMAHEEVESFIPDEYAPVMRELRAKIHRFIVDHKEAIRDCRPAMDSDLLHNRQRDNAGVLLQIADVIGGDVPIRARAAIKALTRGDVQDIYEVLLEDVASILLDQTVMVNYAGAGQPANMRPIGWNNTVFSSDLCDLIVQYFPHRETYTGFTPARLATMLDRFDIKPEPRVKRRGSDNGSRWYRRDAFEWFIRYGFEPPEPVEMEADSGSDGSGEPAQTSAEGATPIQDAPDQGNASSDVAGSTGSVETQEPASTASTDIAYPNAHVEGPRAGDKKRADALRRAVDALFQARKVDAERVRFICARFWVIDRPDAVPVYAHLNEHGDLGLLPIAAPGLAAEKEGTIRVNPDTALKLADADFIVVRALVNKAARKLSG